MKPRKRRRFGWLVINNGQRLRPRLLPILPTLLDLRAPFVLLLLQDAALSTLDFLARLCSLWPLWRINSIQKWLLLLRLLLLFLPILLLNHRLLNRFLNPTRLLISQIAQFTLFNLLVEFENLLSIVWAMILALMNGVDDWRLDIKRSLLVLVLTPEQIRGQGCTSINRRKSIFGILSLQHFLADTKALNQNDQVEGVHPHLPLDFVCGQQNVVALLRLQGEGLRAFACSLKPRLIETGARFDVLKPDNLRHVCLPLLLYREREGGEVDDNKAALKYRVLEYAHLLRLLLHLPLQYLPTKLDSITESAMHGHDSRKLIHGLLAHFRFSHNIFDDLFLAKYLADYDHVTRLALAFRLLHVHRRVRP